jgi:chromosome partitioning protein
MAPQAPKTPVVSVLNMKGGVGKTTITANVFREIFRTHATKSLLIDFDPQFNLSQLLLAKDEYETLKSSGKTLLNVMDPPPNPSVFTTSALDTITVNNVDDYTHRIRYITGKPEIELRLLPGDFEIAMLNLRESPQSLELPRKRFDLFVNKAKETYKLIVLDCNPSSSFLTRCAIENSTHLLVPVRPDRYSVLGVEMIHSYLNKIPTLVNKPEVIILLNDLHSDPDHSEVEAQLRAHTVYGPKTLTNYVPRTKILASKTSYAGFAVDRTIRNGNRKVRNSNKIATELRIVGTEIAKRLGVI